MFKRILTGYLLVLLVSFVVLTLAFSLTVRRHLVQETIASLHREADVIAGTISHQGMMSRGPMRGGMIRLFTSFAQADYLLVGEDGVILESSRDDYQPPGTLLHNDQWQPLLQGTENELVGRDLVAVAYSLQNERGQEAKLLLFTRLEVLSRVNRELLGYLALALFFGSAVSLAAGVLVTRRLVRPLNIFKVRAGQLARRQFQGKLTIETGDELEELADSFNRMSHQLEEYDKAQKSFFQMASHELKTPLMSIQGYAEALKDGVLPPQEQNKSLEIIIKECGRLKSLVEQFIFLSRMESLQDEYNFQKMELKDAVEEALDVIGSLALEKYINLQVNYDKPAAVQADPEKIHMLLINILSNALRHASQRVNIQVYENNISVADDGPGFTSRDLENIFRPFYKGSAGGSGLGMTISNAIVESHGGAIKAANLEEGGAVITISLPRRTRFSHGI